MKKYVQKGISLALVLSMTTCGLAGCGETKESKDTKETTTTSTSVNEQNVESLLTSKIGNAGDTDKHETVYVEMNSDGTVSKTIVSDKLKVSGKDNIKDISNLEDIKNISGDEKFTYDDDGNIIWENKGKNISYQGTTTQTPPLDISIKYYLDDQEISPEDLAGKSGKVKIEYQYTNNSKEEGNFVPFIALTGMILDDSFSNVKVENGKSIQYEDSNIVIGYGAPGIKDELESRISKADEYLKDVEIPDSFSVTADVKDFQMDMAVTVATSEIGDLDLSDSLDLSNVESQMNELKDGTNQLQDGAGQLKGGAEKLKDGSSQVNTGAQKIAKYTADLFSGTTQLLESYTLFDSSMVSAVKSAKEGSDKLYAGTKSVKSASKKLDDGAKKLDSAAGDLNDGAKQIRDGLKSAKAGFEDSKNSDGTTKAGLKSGASQLAEGTKTANQGVQKVVGVLQSAPSEIEGQIQAVVDKVSASTGGAIGTKAKLNAVVEGINEKVTGGAPLENVVTAYGLTTSQYYGLLNAYYSIQTLEQVQTSFEQKIAANKDDITELLTGMNTLQSGASELNTGINTLYTGISTLYSGAAQLASGTGQLKSGTGTLSDGTGQLKSGANDLNAGMKTLNDGTKEMNSKLGDASSKVKDGIGTVNSGAGQISDGAKTLADGTKTLGNGVVSLFDGTVSLKDGVIKLNKDGISKITDIFGKDAKNAVNDIEDILNNGKDYKSFTGIDENMNGEVKFIFRTSEIKSDK